MFGVASVARNFVPIFFGRGYEKAATLMIIFCPMILLMGIENVIGTQYMLPTKRQKEYTISVSIGVLINLILNFILINLCKSVGASIATVLSQLVVDTIQIYFVRKDLKWKPIIRIAVRYFISSIAMFIICISIKLIINKSLITIILQVLIGSMTYIGMLILFKDKFLYTILEKIKEKFSSILVER